MIPGPSSPTSSNFSKVRACTLYDSYEEKTQGKEPKITKEKKRCSIPENLSSFLLTVVVLPLWEALPGVMLPLSVGNVGTDISHKDNEGARCVEKGGGWSTKKHEM